MTYPRPRLTDKPDTTPNVGIAVPGILAPGNINGTAVNLAPYFTGMLASSNRGGQSGVAINFLDGGAATPLMANMPANSTSGNQYELLTHLYEYFGTLLGCTMQGQDAFPAYQGQASMYEVHKFMDLNYAEVTYFIQQVGLAAESFGVTSDDAAAVGMALNNAFNYRCAPPATVVPSQGMVLESICIADDCPLAANATCSSYNATMMPAAANSTNMSNGTSTSSGSSGSGSSSSGSSGSSGTASPDSSAATVGLSVAAVFGGLFALFL